MNLIDNVTKFTHRNMPSWGTGVLVQSDGPNITVNFENAGIKKFVKKHINTFLIVMDEPGIKADNSIELNSQDVPQKSAARRSTLIQYDGEDNSIAGKNIIEAFEGNDSVIFNETYFVIGDNTKACKIHGMYNLTFIGDITVQECVVNGSLTIFGNAHITNLTCQNELICKGNLFSEKIYVGGDMIVDSVTCDELICDGNVAVKTTANINQLGQVAKTIVAYEGIMGAGKFTVQNAIANEYFEFDGDYEGKIIELETDSIISDNASQKVLPDKTIEEVITLANQKLKDEYEEYTSLDIEEVINHLRRLYSIENKELKLLPSAAPLLSELAKLSSQNRIETLEEYLTVLVAKKLLPEKIFIHESLNNLKDPYLTKARSDVTELTFQPVSIEQFTRVLFMAVKFENKLSKEWECIMDKIFESVGLKYITVSSMLQRNKLENEENLAVIEQQVKINNVCAEKNQVLEKQQIRKSDFLAQKLSHAKNKYGFTDLELERMTTLKIKTFDDLIKAPDEKLIKVFGKKAFLAKHLIQVRDKVMEKIADME